MRLVQLMAVMVVLGACAADELSTVDLQPLSAASTAPSASFDLRDDGTWVSPGPLEGRVSDGEQAASTLLVEVVSAVDGPLFFGNPDANGRWVWDGSLSLGENPVEVTVVDREGNLTAESALLRVRGNRAPLCQIVAPLPGSEVAVRTDVRFRARVSDPDGDPIDVLWRSSLDGGLANGDDFVLRLRQPGAHDISIEVRDPYGGTCTDVVRVNVR